MNDSFKRLMALARRTGDRLIVTDPEGAEAFVLMGIDEYEGLLDARSAEGDVREEKGSLPVPVAVQNVHNVPVVEELSVAKNQEPTSEAKIEIQNPKSEILETPVERQSPDAVPQTSEPKEEEFGEEQFYLEPIE